MKSCSSTEMTVWEMTKRYGFHFASLIAVMVFMVIGYSPMLSVFYSTVLAFAMSALAPETALGPRKLLIAILVIGAGAAALFTITPIGGTAFSIEFETYFALTDPGSDRCARLYRADADGTEMVPSSKKLTAAMADGSIGVLSAATTCAAAGIIVGIVTLTGLGLKFSSIVIDFAGGSLLLTAIYTSLVVWIIGLAVPVTASYIICAVIAAPALTKLGVPDFAAHMFIFYYAVLSEVSPPTALSPFAAAAITGGDPYITTMQAWKYTLPAFLVPFVFVLDPQGVGLLMKIPKDGSVYDIVWVTAENRHRAGGACGGRAKLGVAAKYSGRAMVMDAGGPAAGVPEPAGGPGRELDRPRCSISCAVWPRFGGGAPIETEICSQ